MGTNHDGNTGGSVEVLSFLGSIHDNDPSQIAGDVIMCDDRLVGRGGHKAARGQTEKEKTSLTWGPRRHLMAATCGEM